MIINHNLIALNTYNKFNKANTAKCKAMEKLSSGLRINKAGDDASGLCISEKMRGQIRGLEQAGRNIQDGISLIQVAEGGLAEIENPNLQRMRELCVQSANGTLNDEDRRMIQEEINQIKKGINDIANNTEFNGIKILNADNEIPGYVLEQPIVGFSTTCVYLKIKPGKDIAISYENIIEVFEAAKNGNIGGSLTKSLLSTFTASVVGDEIHINPGSAYTGGQSGFQWVTWNTYKLSSVPSDTYEISFSLPSNDSIIFQFDTNISSNMNAINIQTGANANEKISINIANCNCEGLGIAHDKPNITTQSGAEQGIEIIDNAINKISSERGKLGAYQNLLEHSLNNVSNYAENLTSAESRIRDADMAKEIMEMTKQSILEQSSHSLLKQAQQMPESILQLLKG